MLPRVKPSEFSDSANKNLRKSTNFHLFLKMCHFAPYFRQFSFKKDFPDCLRWVIHTTLKYSFLQL